MRAHMSSTRPINSTPPIPRRQRRRFRLISVHTAQRSVTNARMPLCRCIYVSCQRNLFNRGSRRRAVFPITYVHMYIYIYIKFLSLSLSHYSTICPHKCVCVCVCKNHRRRVTAVRMSGSAAAVAGNRKRHGPVAYRR